MISTVLRLSAHIIAEWAMGIHLQIDGDYNAHKTKIYKNSSVRRTRVLRSTGPTDRKQYFGCVWQPLLAKTPNNNPSSRRPGYIGNFSATCVARVAYRQYLHMVHDKWVPVTTAWGVLRLRMEEWLAIWRVAANVLNKQSGRVDKRWSSSFGVSEVLTTPHRKNWRLYERDTFTSGLNWRYTEL
jgi:hypothetical protein